MMTLVLAAGTIAVLAGLAVTALVGAILGAFLRWRDTGRHRHTERDW